MREAQGDKELGRQSRCMDKLRATMAGAYIRALRAPQGGRRRGNCGGRAAAWTSRYEGWRIYTRFARTTGLILNLVEGNQRA